jgi:CHAT domain-containing protein/Tfp pilus assembly protein PilF
MTSDDVPPDSPAELALDDPFIFYQIAARYQLSRQTELATAAYAQALTLLEKRGDGQTGLAATIHNQLGNLKAPSSLDDALSHYLAAWARRSDLHGEDSLEVAHIVNNIATLFHQHKMPSHAVGLYLDVLRIRCQLGGEDYYETVHTLSHLAIALLNFGFVEEARQYAARMLTAVAPKACLEQSRAFVLCWSLVMPPEAMPDTRKAVAPESWPEGEWDACEGNLTTIAILSGTCKQRADRVYHESWMQMEAQTVRLRYFAQPDRIGRELLECACSYFELVRQVHAGSDRVHAHYALLGAISTLRWILRLLKAVPITMKYPEPSAPAQSGAKRQWRQISGTDVTALLHEVAEIFALAGFLEALNSPEVAEPAELATDVVHLCRTFGMLAQAQSIAESLMQHQSFQHWPGVSQSEIHHAVGMILAEQGRFQESREHMQRALSQAGGTERGNILFSLGKLARMMGDYPRSKHFLAQASELLQDDSRYGLVLQQTAITARLCGDLDQAEQLLTRAIELVRETSDWDAGDQMRESLAIIHRQRGDFQKALALYEELLERAGHRAVPNQALFQFNYGYCLQATGELRSGREHLLEAARLFEAAGGLGYTILPDVFANLASVEIALGLFPEALQHVTAGLGACRAIIAGIQGMSDDQTLKVLMSLGKHYHDFLGAALDCIGVLGEPAQRAAVSTVLLFKGRQLDLAIDHYRRLRARPTAATDHGHKTLAALAFRLLRDDLPAQSVSELQARFERFNEDGGSSLDVSGVISRTITPELDQILAGLRPGDTLLEIVKLGRWNRQEEAWNFYYTAVFLAPGAAPRWLPEEMGAEDIEWQIQTLLHPAAPGREVDQDAIRQNLYHRLLEPFDITERVTGVLYIAPDGDFQECPFASLRPAPGEFLIERTTVSVISSGRELVSARSSLPSPSNDVVVVVSPDYDSADSDAPASAPQADNPTKNIIFQPLLGTAREGRSLQAILGSRVTLLQAREATKDCVMSLKSPHILHIATHGYHFTAAKFASEGAAPLLSIAPMVCNGLALAGANKGPEGLLTAMELADCQLTGTELVVLSACNTGRGINKTGDGVYGLRRAIQLSGARGHIVALWPIDDDGTVRVMESIYKEITEGFTPAVAVRRAQCSAILSPDLGHPRYWAAFSVGGVQVSETRS